MTKLQKTLIFLGFVALIAPLLLMLTYSDYSRAGSGTIEYGAAETQYWRTQPVWAKMLTIAQMWMFSFLGFWGLNLIWPPLAAVLLYFGVRRQSRKAE